MKTDAEGTHRVVEIEIEVKSWAQSLPTAADVRPARCPACEAPGLVDERVVLHGHGVRGRQCWGPPEPDRAGVRWTLSQRRYACQCCKAVVVVRPRGVMPWRRYTAAAIAVALWLWGVDGKTDANVRDAVAVEPKPGLSRPERWTTLRRWAAAARESRLWHCLGDGTAWTLRQGAERVARFVAGFADATIANPRARAFAGAAHAR